MKEYTFVKQTVNLKFVYDKIERYQSNRLAGLGLS